ncbi:MAG TPA: hypothetical protein VKE51_29595 [Vicinamibacterales bacterium]|nr:hypothetical protein [Vicinamibacterales bacterium]
MKRRAKPVAATTDSRIDELVQTLKDDPAFTPVIRDFLASRDSRGRAFGSNALKVNGKLFALFTQDTLVVKLPRDRVADLIASKVGKPFDPGHGRLMKEWLTVTSRRASWSELTRESYAFVRGGRR